MQMITSAITHREAFEDSGYPHLCLPCGRAAYATPYSIPPNPYPAACPEPQGPTGKAMTSSWGAGRLEVPTASEVSYPLTNFTAENSL